MSIDAFAARLGDLEIFRGLTPIQLTRIAREAERIVFRDGQEIIQRGVAGDAAYLIVAGHAEAMAVPDAGLDAQSVSEGSLLGEMAMLIDHDYAVTVRAHGTVRALRLSRETMLGLLAKDPDLADHFVARISSRLTKVAVELRRVDQMLAMAAEGLGAPA
jgi:CRP-like cAMP-binding protein